MPLPMAMSAAAKFRSAVQVEELRPLLYRARKRTTLCNRAQISRADGVEVFCDGKGITDAKKESSGTKPTNLKV